MQIMYENYYVHFWGKKNFFKRVHMHLKSAHALALTWFWMVHLQRQWLVHRHHGYILLWHRLSRAGGTVMVILNYKNAITPSQHACRDTKT